jgi:hydroxymethylbilane synthase
VVHLRLGTRGSLLALRQSESVRDLLAARGPETTVELVVIHTHGDRAADVPLHLLSGQGVFAGAIEEALLRGEIDLAVHSLKDLPAAERPGLRLAAFPARADARDALVAREARSLDELRPGARVATGSPRRAVQLRAARPDVEIVDIRGNLDTRLRKLETEGLDALVLAVAGLERLGLADRISEPLSPALCLPAVGQGALAVQCRADDERTAGLITELDHRPTRAAVLAERAFLAALGGGCKVPIAAHAQLDGDVVVLTGLLAAADGAVLLRDTHRGLAAAPDQAGEALATRLLATGGTALVEGRARE